MLPVYVVVFCLSALAGIALDWHRALVWSAVIGAALALILLLIKDAESERRVPANAVSRGPRARVHAIVEAVLEQRIDSDGELLIQDLGMDSLDCVELVMALEEDFGLEIPDDIPDTWRTVGDVVAYIERREAR